MRFLRFFGEGSGSPIQGLWIRGIFGRRYDSVEGARLKPAFLLPPVAWHNFATLREFGEGPVGVTGFLVDRGNPLMNAGSRRVERFGGPVVPECSSEPALGLCGPGEEKLVVRRVRGSAFQILGGDAGEFRVAETEPQPSRRILSVLADEL